MADDFVFNTPDDFIFESSGITTPGVISGYSFDGNDFDFISGTVNIIVTGENSSVFAN